MRGVGDFVAKVAATIAAPAACRVVCVPSRLRRERTGRELRVERTRPRPLAGVSFLSAVAQAGACVVRARRRGVTIVSRDRRGCACVSHEGRVPARRKPACRGGSRRRSAHEVWRGFRLSQAVSKVDLRSPSTPLSVACGGDRSAVARRTFYSYRRRSPAIDRLPFLSCPIDTDRSCGLHVVLRIFFKAGGHQPAHLCFNRERFVRRFVGQSSDRQFWLVEALNDRAHFQKSPATTNSRSGNHQVTSPKKVRESPRVDSLTAAFAADVPATTH